MPSGEPTQASTSQWDERHVKLFAIKESTLLYDITLKRLFGEASSFTQEYINEPRELFVPLNSPQDYTRKEMHQLLEDIDAPEYERFFLELSRLKQRKMDKSPDPQPSRTSLPRAKKLAIEYGDKSSQEEDEAEYLDQSQEMLEIDDTEGGREMVDIEEAPRGHLKRMRVASPASSESGDSQSSKALSNTASNYSGTDSKERLKATKLEMFSVNMINAFLDLIVKKHCETEDDAGKHITLDLHEIPITLSIKFGNESMASANDGALVAYVTSTEQPRYRPLEPLDPVLLLECKQKSADPSKLPMPQLAGEFIAAIQQRVHLQGEGDPARLSDQERTVMGMVVQGEEVTMVYCTFAISYLNGLHSGVVEGDMTMFRTPASKLDTTGGRRNVSRFVLNVLRSSEQLDSWVVRGGMKRIVNNVMATQ